MNALRITDLSMVFENGFQALKKVSVEARAGEFITLLGPSGCGKTTLLKLIAGFLTPSEGHIAMNDQDITALPPEKRDTAMVFQSYALFPHMTVSDNITFGLKQKRLAKQEQVSRLEDVLGYVSLETQKDKQPKGLSGGQQQRVALARALAMRPSVILFDEPLSNLDAKLREQVRFEIRKLQRDHGFTAIYVTHDQAEALAMSDKIYLMNEGQVVQAGSPQEIYHHPNNRFVADFLGVANLFVADIIQDNGNGDYQISCPFGLFNVQSDKAPTAKQVHMCWRPEDAKQVAPNTANSFELEVLETVFLGNLTDVFAKIPGQNESYRAQFLQYQNLKAGSIINVALEPHHLHFLESTE